MNKVAQPSTERIALFNIISTIKGTSTICPHLYSSNSLDLDKASG